MILFYLLNAPTGFQGYINKILTKKLNLFVIVYLDNILIYTKDEHQGHVNTTWWVLKELKKYCLFANLKKCCFHKNKVCFSKYIILAQGLQMQNKKMEVVRNCLEPKSMRDIQVFLNFANFYQYFIQSFIKIAVPLTSIFKTSFII